MRDNTTLGEFLRSRRARLTPDDVGITSYGQRRVSGLRREELAQLAGVSPTYYTRLEQGQSHQASPSILEALADALQLTIDERAYLHSLAHPRVPARRRRAKAVTARPATRRLVETLGMPALLIGTRTEVLAWNLLGHLLFGGHLDPDGPSHPAYRPNLTKLLFLDPHHRDLYPRWEIAAACAVASLRMAAAADSTDHELAELIGELSLNSTEFARLWARHPVAAHAYGPRHLIHPEIGEITLELETMTLADGSGHRVLLYSAAPGSPSEAALELLRLRAGGRTAIRTTSIYS